MFIKHIIIVSMTLILSGCLVLREGKSPLLDPLPKESIKSPKKVFVELKLIIISEDGTFIWSTDKTKDFSEHFKEVLMESGAFQVVDDKSAANITMTVETTQNNIKQNNFWAFISGVSLFTIPYRGEVDFTTSLVVTEGEKKKNYQHLDHATVWVHLLLFPAQWLHMSVRDVMDNMYRHMIQEARSDFSPP